MTKGVLALPHDDELNNSETFTKGQDRVVRRKPINAKPGLKDNREFSFISIKVFILLMFCEDLDNLTSKLE